MSNLIPERRADKRGNIVTRWVRSFSQKKPSRDIPAPWPSISIPELKGNPLEAEITKLCAILQPSKTMNPSNLLTANVSYIAERDPELLKRITEVTEKSRDECSYWEFRLARGHVLIKKSREDKQYAISNLRNTFAVKSALDRIAASGGDIMPNGTDRMGMDSSVNGILRDGELIDPPEQFVEAVTMIAYIKGTHTPDSWDEEDGGYLGYSDISDDAGYIGGRLDEIALMLPELRARKAYDRATIEALRDSPAQVLRSGEL